MGLSPVPGVRKLAVKALAIPAPPQDTPSPAFQRFTPAKLILLLRATFRDKAVPGPGLTPGKGSGFCRRVMFCLEFVLFFQQLF